MSSSYRLGLTTPVFFLYHILFWGQLDKVVWKKKIGQGFPAHLCAGVAANRLGGNNLQWHLSWYHVKRKWLDFIMLLEMKADLSCLRWQRERRDGRTRWRKEREGSDGLMGEEESEFGFWERERESAAIILTEKVN